MNNSPLSLSFFGRPLPLCALVLFLGACTALVDTRGSSPADDDTPEMQGKSDIVDLPPTHDDDPSSSREQAMERTFVHHLRSDHVDENYRITVAMPDTFLPGLDPAPDADYPVIYVLDGYWAFGGTAEFVRTQAPYSIPHAIVVGIGYDDSTALGRLQRRCRDFTPSSWDLYAQVNDPQVRALQDQGLPSAFEGYPMGGAEDFLQFVREELKPFIEAHYPADASDSTILGSSFGGLFATYALFNAPDTFQRYVIISPGLNWDDAMMAQQEADYAREHDDLPARVFLAAGSREEEQRAASAQNGDSALRELELSYKMVERAQGLAETLRGRNYPNLQVYWKLIEGENHVTVAGPGMTNGLRAVFESQFFFSL